MIIPRRAKRKIDKIGRMRYWNVIADNLKKAGWSWGCVATVDLRMVNNLDCGRAKTSGIDSETRRAIGQSSLELP